MASLILADRITGDRSHPHHRQESENLNSFSEAIAPWEIASKLHCFSQARKRCTKRTEAFMPYLLNIASNPKEPHSLASLRRSLIFPSTAEIATTRGEAK
ncbi:MULTISPECIES: hypothetical protein [unclassified Microcoleus]|uniref:hypothetical protein n=1 Tax=unclassified Microcoleus TaxID=2642155 RepID=UPI002FD370F0